MSGKESHKQLGAGTVVTSGSLAGVMVSTLALIAKEASSIPALGTLFSHLHHTHDTGFEDQDPVQVVPCIVDEHRLCMYM